ncbi:MAG: alanine--glyoxylate aminotransferase family protein [Firmicutes bacterium]|nr:alanine--glyoxylate aminotransferase family protein [Bacillota bacterium]
MRKEYLMIPGPTPCPEEVLQAMGCQVFNHRGGRFASLLKETIASSKIVFQTEHDVLVFASSGTGVMEAAVVNVLSPGDHVLALIAGGFGRRFTNIAKAYGARIEAMEVPEGQRVEAEAVAARLKQDTERSIKAIIVVHSETTTGVLHDIRAISEARGDHPALLVVDVISSLGCAEFKMDAWKVDVAVTASQKGLMTPPGLGLAAVAPRAWEAAKQARMPRFYFDFQKMRDYAINGQTPFTPAVSLVMALKEALTLILEEGLDKAVARQVTIARACQAGVKALGLKLFGNEAFSTPSVTTVWAPDNFDVGQFRKVMRDKYRVVLGGGQGHLVDQIFRVGHLGAVQQTELLAVVSAMELGLRDCGYPAKLGAGVGAAEEVLSGGVLTKAG